MVEADSLLKLLAGSIKDIYKVFERINMLSIGIQQQSFTVSDFGVVIVNVWSQNDVISSWLRLIATSNCFLHPC